MNHEIAIQGYLFNWNFCTKNALLLVSDVADEQMAAQPVAGINHPAWLLGHLCVYHDTLSHLLRNETFDNPWHKPCGKLSEPVADRSQYLSKDQLVATFEQGQADVAELLKQVTQETLAAPIPHDQWGKPLNNVGEAVAFLTGGHCCYHIGQISTWRRAMSLPRV